MAEKVSLFDDSESYDDESEVELKINKEYANKYDQWREKECLQRYKDLQEEVSTSSSSESEIEEDPEFDKNFFRLLSLLKGNDPKIHDKDFVAFPGGLPKQKTKKKEKPLSIKEYETKVVLENKGEVSSEEEEEEDSAVKAKSKRDAELARLKNALMDDESDEEEDLKSDQPPQDEKAGTGEESEDFIKYLKGEEASIPEDSQKELSYLRNSWNDPNLDEDEKFLRDFFLNKTYKEKDDGFNVMEEIDKLSEDEKFEKEQEQFEHKYNFRFEEPDPDFIKRYPRTIGDSLRRKDTRRKQQRDEYTERKQQEKEQKREELKRLKAVKRKEIEEKFLKLQEITGKDELNFDESDIESDFDPDKHDQKMKELFDDQYYAVEEEQKPVFEFDEEIDELDWNHWSRTENQDQSEDKAAGSEEDDPVNGTEVNQKVLARKQFEQEMLDSTKDRKHKQRKKSLFAKILANPKPIYDPEGKSFDEYLDEYYKMDYEDIVSGMPVRFKYRRVIPNDFGLSVDEILKADDKDLNRWCSIKKTCQYRQEEEEKYDLQAFKKKAENPYLKKKVLASVYAEPEVDNSEVKNDDNSKTKKKRRKKKKKQSEGAEVKKEAEDFENNQSVKNSNENSAAENLNSDKSKKNKRKKAKNKNSIQNSDVETMETCENSDVVSEEKPSVDSANNSKRKRKKSKKKKNTFENSDTAQVGHLNKSKDCESISEDPKSGVDQILIDSPKSKKKRLSESYSEMEPANKKVKSENGIESEIQVDSKKSKKKRNKKKKFQNSVQNNELKAKSNPVSNKNTDKRLALSDERLAAYGINPKKFKNKIKYSKQN